MTRTLRFGSTESDPPLFALLYDGFVAGGNALHVNAGRPMPRERDERAKEAKILKALKALSEETDAATGRRKLKKDGGVLALDQKCHEVLARYVEAAPFDTSVSDRVDALIDWIAAADKTDDVIR